MFLLDDLLMSPVRGFMMIAREIHKAALAEREAYARELTQRLSTLYAALEAGEITETEFDEQEERILDLLDELESIADEAPEGTDDRDSSDDDDPDDDQDGDDTEGSLTVQLLDLPGDAA